MLAIYLWLYYTIDNERGIKYAYYDKRWTH